MSYANCNIKTQPKAKSQELKPKAKAKSQSQKPKAKSKSEILAPKCNKKHANQRFWLQNAANSKENCPRLNNNKKTKEQPKKHMPSLCSCGAKVAVPNRML